MSGKSEAQYNVMSSKHLAFAFPVRTEDEIKATLEHLWKVHHNATHISYAWRLGWEKKRYRINDDGEPAGTAGNPIFGQIKSFDLTNVLVAVVRHYGGTNLGTGGLIDAYKTSSKMAIEAAAIIERPVMDQYRLTFDPTLMPVVMKLLKELDMEKINTNFGDICEIEFLLKISESERLIEESLKWIDAKLFHLGRS